MPAGIRPSIAALCTVLLAHAALAQDKPPELTPAGKAVLKSILAAADKPPPGPIEPPTFPHVMCAFHGGLCGAVRRDGTIAVPPRYDWVGRFSDGRAAVRVGGLYGFVDEEGREIVKPQYRIVGDYKHGFAQVDVDGKSGLIDRDGRMVIEPKYAFIEAIGPDRFRVSDARRIGGMKGGEDFSGRWFEFTSNGVRMSLPPELFGLARPTGVIDVSERWIEPLIAARAFDENDPSIRWIQKDKLWGLARADGTWVVEPKFEQADLLRDGLARVTINRKMGFVDRTGRFAIEPVFDKAWSFEPGVGRTSAARDGVFGVIDKTGSWVFQTSYQQVHLARTYGKDRNSRPPFGWHFKQADRWGLLDLDGRVVLDADFDQTVQSCGDGRLVAYKGRESLLFKADGSPLQPSGRLVDGFCGGTPPYTLKIGDKFGLVAADGTPVTPVHFEAIAWSGHDARNVKIGGKWGRIGLDGRWLVDPKFDYLSGGPDLYVAAVDGKRGFMRADGTWLIEPRFEAARLRNADTAFVTISGATGVLRLKDQSWAIPPRPGVMCDIANAILSKSDRRRALLSPAGEAWIDIDADLIGLGLDIGLLAFRRDGKWGLVDTAGQVIVEPTYDELTQFWPSLRGVAWAKRAGLWCAIDRRGRTVPGIACTEAIGLPSGVFPCKVEW